MIVTVTPNPSLDRTIEVDALVRGAVHRAGPLLVDAGGKGVNVGRALAANEHKVRAVLPAGGADGDLLAVLLARTGIDHVAVPIAETVRTNVSIVEADGTTTKLNTPGPDLTPAEADALAAAAVEAAGGAAWAACCGSLPPGVADDYYARLVAELRAAGCAVAVDTSGPALRAAIAAAPDLVKPNREELEELAGRALPTLGAVVEAAEALRDRGVGTVLASLGPDGALLVDADGVVHAEAPVETVRSTVGAGDATLAGFLSGGARGPAALVTALAWGAAAVGLPGSRMPTPTDLRPDRVTVHHRVAPDRAL